MEFLGAEIAPLGMGCWPIGGEMYSGTQSLGYSRSDDDQSLRTIHAALDHGITLFDTAAAYGAGHSERLLGQALKSRADALIATKIGIGIDEKTKQLTGPQTDPAQVMPAIDDSLRRLDRGHIDLLLLHLNSLSVAEAEPLFDEMDRAVRAGKLRAYGWSTDFTKNVAAVSARPAFQAVEHAMNLFVDVPRMQKQVEESGVMALIRSPLAMGLLSGKYSASESLPEGDIRASGQLLDWASYFKEGKGNPDLLADIEAVRDLLTSDGRTLVQGALGWIWGKRPANIAIPGARTPEQIEGLAGALAFGPLPAATMAQIETLITRAPDDGEDKER